MDRIRLKQAVVVEGKYDKIKLEAVVDALILTTGGFGIYRDRETQALLRRLARERGLLVLTDSDAAGFRIRGYLSGIIPDGEITHVYIPDVFGKEKRKRSPSAEGKLGVEGIDVETLRQALGRAGVLESAGETEAADPITHADWYRDGLSGGKDSAQRRRRLLRALDLPAGLSTSAALKVLNRTVTRREYRELLDKLEKGGKP